MIRTKIETLTYIVDMISYTHDKMYSVSIYNKNTDHIDNFYNIDPLDFITFALCIYTQGNVAVINFLGKLL